VALTGARLASETSAAAGISFFSTVVVGFLLTIARG
jgi:hypothetical protein